MILRFAMVMFIFTSLFYLVFLQLQENKNPTEAIQTITLSRLEVSREDSNSRVYEATTGDERRFLISADGVLYEPEDKSYTLREIHVNDFWNPITCSRMPFIKNGSRVYFLEIQRMFEDGVSKNMTSLYVLDTENELLTMYKLPAIPTTGYLYKKEAIIYLAVPEYKDSNVSQVILYSFEEDLGVLEKMKEVDVAEMNIKEAVFKPSNLQFALSYIDSEFVKHSLIYDGVKLVPSLATPEENVSYEETFYKIYSRANENYGIKTDLRAFDYLEVFDGKTQDILLELENDGVNKYIITGL